MLQFFDKVLKTDGCWLWQGDIGVNGYGRIQIDKVRTAAHRLSYQIHKGEIPTGMMVCHDCDNPICVNPAHLWVGTAQDNARDKVNKGRCQNQNGSRNPAAKLSEADVLKIRRLCLPNRAIATIFNINESHVRGIKSRRRWPHLN